MAYDGRRMILAIDLELDAILRGELAWWFIANVSGRSLRMRDDVDELRAWEAIRDGMSV